MLAKIELSHGDAVLAALERLMHTARPCQLKNGVFSSEVGAGDFGQHGLKSI